MGQGGGDTGSARRRAGRCDDPVRRPGAHERSTLEVRGTQVSQLSSELDPPITMNAPVAARAPSTVAVVVTYRPDVGRLTESLNAVLPQVDSVVIVDNGSHAGTLDGVASIERVSVLRLDTNRGIAFAQNRGIEKARAQGAAFVLLLDQDSVVGPGMVARLAQECASLVARGERVGAVGPAWVNGGADVPARFTVFRRARYLQIEAPPGAGSVPCDMLIASGTLIPMAALDEVGAMDEALFIDKVDTEWSLRVRRLGFGLYGVPGARLHHRLGESVLTVRWWRGKQLPVHKPFRYYYMVRNSVLLQRAAGMRWAWRLADASQMLQIVLFHGFLAPQARQNRHMIWRGLTDGLRAVTGPMPTA